MIRQKALNARYFFYSRHVSDALLITAGILVPSLILARYELFETGVVVSLGALCVGVTDLPGPFREKMGGLLICNAIIFLVALITGYAGVNVYLESAEIVTFCFFFSMFTLYGSRAASIGTTALMVMILMMYRHKEASGVPGYAGLLLAGGLWYSLLSFLFYKLLPYRQIQQVLGECIIETARSLQLKSKLYDLHTDQAAGLNALIIEQSKLNEKQDDVRQLLFSNPLITKNPTVQGRVMTAAFVELMDVYEQVVSTSYYETIRVRFSKSRVLTIIESLLGNIAENLKSVGYAIQANRMPRRWMNVNDDFLKLKKTIDAIAEQNSESTFILKKALVTFRTLDQRVQNMAGYLTSPETIVTDHSALFRFDLFLTPRQYSPQVYLDNLSLQSSTFRYAVRVALVAFAGFMVAGWVSGAGHSYWILFTVVFILKPAFSLSKARNYQRIGGTILGGMISFPIILFVHNNTALFIFLMSFMVIAYSFMRINYLIFVVFMTSYVLLMFKLLGTGSLNILEERVIDTAIGALLAFAAIYFIFPNWEFKQVRIHIREMLWGNRNYLHILQEYFSGKDISLNDYKLARKNAYHCFANLSGSFQRMNSEPKSKRKNIDEIQHFIVLNHRLSSMISSNTSSIFTGKLAIFRNVPENLEYLRQGMTILDDSLTIIENSDKGQIPVMRSLPAPPSLPENSVVKSQLRSIRELCGQIEDATFLIFKR